MNGVKDFAGRVVVNIHAGDNGAQEVGGSRAGSVTRGSRQTVGSDPG